MCCSHDGTIQKFGIRSKPLAHGKDLKKLKTTSKEV